MDSTQVQAQTPIDTPIQQTPAPSVPKDSAFDTFLKRSVDFVARFIRAFNAASKDTASVEPKKDEQAPKQDIPGATFLGKIGTTVNTIGDTAKKVTTAVQKGADKVMEKTEEYIADQPADPVVQPKDFISKNYHPNTQEVQK